MDQKSAAVETVKKIEKVRDQAFDRLIKAQEAAEIARIANDDAEMSGDKKLVTKTRKAFYRALRNLDLAQMAYTPAKKALVAAREWLFAEFGV